MKRSWSGTRAGRSVGAWAVALVLAGCGLREPISIGFLGGLAAQGFNVSEDGRNGALLAVEEVNRQGGVHGRLLTLVVREIAHEKHGAQDATRALLAAQVQAIVGPFTSTQALAVLPLADEAGTLLISPTANAPELQARDDQMVLLNGALGDSARAYAQVLAQRGLRRMAVAFDESNHAYSGQWLAAFRTRLAERGGEMVVQAGFSAGTELSYAAVVRQLLAAGPDGLLFIGRGPDAARLAQQVRKQGVTVPLATAEWATTDSLIELGGRAVEGLVTAQPYDPGNTSARYQAFLGRYRERHGREPSFGALGAYDAVMVLAEAMARADPGAKPRDAVLRHGPYTGLQHPIAFDRFGDSTRPLHFVEVRDGAFAPLR